jgi:hypothetical protein
MDGVSNWESLNTIMTLYNVMGGNTIQAEHPPGVFFHIHNVAGVGAVGALKWE